MNELDVLQDVAERLNRLGIPYMLTGSMAMNYYAVPRMTRDVDIVISLSPDNIGKFISELESDYMIVEEAVVDAVDSEFMFNAIHNESIVKVDFVCRKRDEYRLLEFERRRIVNPNGVDIFIVSPEDLVLSKLVWMKDSESEMQAKDIENLLPKITEEEYLSEWAEKLGVKQLLQRIRNQ